MMSQAEEEVYSNIINNQPLMNAYLKWRPPKNWIGMILMITVAILAVLIFFIFWDTYMNPNKYLPFGPQPNDSPTTPVIPTNPSTPVNPITPTNPTNPSTPVDPTHPDSPFNHKWNNPVDSKHYGYHNKIIYNKEYAEILWQPSKEYLQEASIPKCFDDPTTTDPTYHFIQLGWDSTHIPQDGTTLWFPHPELFGDVDKFRGNYHPETIGFWDNSKTAFTMIIDHSVPAPFLYVYASGLHIQATIDNNAAQKNATFTLHYLCSDFPLIISNCILPTGLLREDVYSLRPLRIPQINIDRSYLTLTTDMKDIYTLIVDPLRIWNKTDLPTCLMPALGTVPLGCYRTLTPSDNLFKYHFIYKGLPQTYPTSDEFSYTNGYHHSLLITPDLMLISSATARESDNGLAQPDTISQTTELDLGFIHGSGDGNTVVLETYQKPYVIFGHDPYDLKAYVAYYYENINLVRQMIWNGKNVAYNVMTIPPNWTTANGYDTWVYVLIPYIGDTHMMVDNEEIFIPQPQQVVDIRDINSVSFVSDPTHRDISQYKGMKEYHLAIPVRISAWPGWRYQRQDYTVTDGILSEKLSLVFI